MSAAYIGKDPIRRCARRCGVANVTDARAGVVSHKSRMRASYVKGVDVGIIPILGE